MNNNSSPEYDIIHFEALGPEAAHLAEETARARQEGLLPEQHNCLIVPETVQALLHAHPGFQLPDLISTKTHSLLPPEYLESGERSVITRSAGYDHFEHLLPRIRLTSLREYCVNAVAQTAMKFVYATAGLLNQYEKNCVTFDRNNSQAFMELDRNRIATVFGVGTIGKRIYDLAEANGLTVYGVDIRQEELNRQYQGVVRFISKDQAIATSDIIINAMNYTKDSASVFYNAGYFSADYLSGATKPLLFINVTRGEIAPEQVLLDLFRAGKIIGIGLDVFANEAGFAQAVADKASSEDGFRAARELLSMSIERSANIYVQPHQGFNSDVAVRAKAGETIKHVVAWFRNGGQRFDVQLPYY